MADVTFDITLNTWFQSLDDLEDYSLGERWSFNYTADADMVMVWPNPDLYMLPVQKYVDSEEYKGTGAFALTAGQGSGMEGYGWPFVIPKDTADAIGFEYQRLLYRTYKRNGSYYKDWFIHEWTYRDSYASYRYALSDGSSGQVEGSPTDSKFYLSVGSGVGADICDVAIPAVVTWTAPKAITIDVYFDRQKRNVEVCTYCGNLSENGYYVTIDPSTKAVHSSFAVTCGQDLDLPEASAMQALAPEGRELYVYTSTPAAVQEGGRLFLRREGNKLEYSVSGTSSPHIAGANLYWEGLNEYDIIEFFCVFVVPDSEKLVKFGTLESMLSTYKAKSDEVLDSKLEALPSGGVSAEDVDAKVAEAVSGMDAKLADVAAVPDGGTEGQVLTKTADSYGWADAPEAEPPLATRTEPGMVMVGDNLTIGDDGRLSAVNALPVFDEATGRYTNTSIAAWLDSYADGLVYGVQIPRYKNSTSTKATKTDANAGLVLEPSSDKVAGRNDYLGRKLFMCPRVNGGVDADGMPYVTAIEGMDSMFDSSAADTWALTPVYWQRFTEGDGYYYVNHGYCDSPRDGYVACPGAYVPDGRMRPYILRACYLDSDGDCSSRSGTLPASQSNAEVEGYYPHSADTMLAESHAREDGKSYLSYADLSWKMGFMQLMLGVKAPSAAVAGNGRTFKLKVVFDETNSRVIELAYDEANQLRAGDHLTIGTNSRTLASKTAGTACRAVRVKRVVGPYEDDEVGAWVGVYLDEGVTVTEGMFAWVGEWRNGCCDNVMGTFGSYDIDNLSDGGPARFQNVEFQLGYDEVCCNALLDSGYPIVVPDVGACGSLDFDDLANTLDAGLIAIGDKLPNATDFVADRIDFHGLSCPWNIGATSTTGYAADYYLQSSNADCAWVERSYGDETNMGSAHFYPDWSDGGDWFVGTRASAIGRSKLAD